MRLRLIAGSVVFVLCSQAPNALSQKSIVTCPTSITCNYDAGTCQYPSEWNLDSQSTSESFEGTLTIRLNGRDVDYEPPITGGGYNNLHWLTCNYYYKHSHFSLFTSVDELVGSGWTKAGFGKKYDKCVTDPHNPDVTACAGSRGN